MWTTIISVIALVVSIGSTLFGFRRQKRQMQTTIRDQLSGVAQDLIQALADNEELLGTPPNQQDSVFHRRNSSMQQKLAALSGQASALVNEAPEIVYDVEYSVLAQALEYVGDLPEAERCWKEAVRISRSHYYTIVFKRGYGAFLIRQGEQQRGRATFEEALAIWSNTTDFNKLTNGFTYQFWGSAELVASAHGRAADLFREAREIYETVSSSPLKAQLLNRLRVVQPNQMPLGLTQSSSEQRSASRGTAEARPTQEMTK
jgi:tetratricopeptide (TPR) repeat protein